MERFAARIVAFGLALLTACSCAGAPADSIRSPVVPAQFTDAAPFNAALGTRTCSQATARVTGLVVPHHMPAADLIAAAFNCAKGDYTSVLLLTPDHFRRSKTPFATSAYDFDTAFGSLRTDRAAAGALLASSLFSESDLFGQEHGFGVVAPFIRRHLPEASIIPVAIAADATLEDWKEAAGLLASLVGQSTLIVQSSDFSHYRTMEESLRRDQETLNILAANDIEAAGRLEQPAHIDCVGCQYIHMRLQAEKFAARPVVLAHRTFSAGGPLSTERTSYIVQAFTADEVRAHTLGFGQDARWYFGGDVMFGRWFSAAQADPVIADELYKVITERTGGARMLVNLEGVLLDEPPSLTPDDLHIMHAGLARRGFAALNVRGASLANNHSFDVGPLGLSETRSVLVRENVMPVDHGEIVDFGDFRVLGLNFVRKRGLAGFPIVKEGDLEAVCARTAAPPLIAFVHWGAEYTEEMGEPERIAAEKLFDCGVTAIVGAHSHRRSKAIVAPRGGQQFALFSLGNMMFDQNGTVGSGALLELRVFPEGLIAGRLVDLPNLYDLGNQRLRARAS